MRRKKIVSMLLVATMAATMFAGCGNDSRKKELALLEVVGMTKKQISKMLVAEGFLYLGGAFMIAVLLVVFGAEKILANTLGTAFFFQMHLTIVPCLLMVPILSGIAYAIPKYQFKKMSQESVVERIRKE